MQRVVGLDFLEKILNSSVISPLIIIDSEGKIIFFNKKIIEIYGADDSKSYIGKSIKDYVNIAKISEIKLNDNRLVKFYVDMKEKGELSLNSKVTKIEIENKIYYILTVEDVDREIEQFDPLTNLYNKYYFKMKLKSIIENHKKEGKKLAILMLKIQNFRKINDRFGYNIGDEVLKKIALRLKSNIEPKDFIARTGGSEFCIILTDINKYTDAGIFANQVYEESMISFTIQNYKIKYSLKIGIAAFPDTSQNYHDLMKNAYFALQNSNEESCKFYSKQLEQEYNKKIEFENKLLDAIKNQELYLVYHPQVNLINNKITGVEALLRWDYATSQNICTEKLIQIAEESGLIGKINKYIIKKIENDLKKINNILSNNRMTISINFSAHLSDLQKNLNEVTNLLISLKNKYKNFDFKMELTESSFMEQDYIAHGILKKFFQDLKNNNIKLCVDDFGMEYSSIKRLLNQNFDVIKIHKSFIEMLKNDDNLTAIAIVRSIISLGNDLNFNVVAEGVEELSQVNLLKALGCHFAQGFYFYKPLSIDNLAQVLKEI